jgi:hypothetical protein
MNYKSSKLLAVILLLVVSALFITGCGKSGSRFANKPPTITITSYEGWTDENVPATIDTLDHEYAFQQRIFWNAYDPDGVISGYAFRVLNENLEPIPSPGYQHISRVEDGLIPDAVINSTAFLGNSKEGWVYHYLPSADQSLGLDDPEASRTIWTSQKYAVINFNSADELGNPLALVSHFEVIAIDNRGGIVDRSAWRRFRTSSPRPTCFLDTTKGNPNGGDVGSGIRLKFTMHDTDPFILPIPYKFEFRMMKINDANGSVVPGTDTGWISTEGQDKIDEYRLTANTTPPLDYDYNEDGTSKNTTTRIMGRATDMAGVLSLPSGTEPDSTAMIYFKVKPGFRPRTTLYSRKILALGDNHYEDWGDDYNQEPVPFSLAGGRQRYATSFFRDTDGSFSAVHSNNLKVYVRWGWWGEYETQDGNSFPLDDPYEKKVDVVLSEHSPSVPVNYFSEITHFDIRYDDEPFAFLAFPPADYNHVDPDGKTWLRIPVSSPLMQSIVLTSEQVDPGRHKFEVRCVDMQEKYSQNPAILEFLIHPSSPPANRQGVLIIDDDVNSTTASPDDIVDAKYLNMVSGLGLSADQIKVVKYGGSGVNGTVPDNRQRHISYGLLQDKKMVIYHSDNPTSDGNILKEIDALSLFMQKGGNLVISHTLKFSSLSTEISKSGQRTTLLNTLGLPNRPRFEIIGGALQTNPFMTQATGVAGYPNVNLQITDPPSFNPLVEMRKGLSAVAYYPLDDNGNPYHNGDDIFTLTTKTVGQDSSSPSQAQFDLLNGKTIGIRKVNGTVYQNSRAYLFTFPLSYMRDEETKALINKIWSELL